MTAWDSLHGLLQCLRGGGSCALATGGDGGTFGIVLVIVVALTVGGVILSYQGLVLATDSVALRLADRSPLNVAIGLVAALLWCYLWLAYAIPECVGHTVLTWMIISPLFTLVLMVGFIATVGVVAFTVGSVTSGRNLGGLSGDRWAWALLIMATTGILVGWHVAYDATPGIAAGPFGRGPGWFQDALGVWTLHLPVAALWGLARVLATTAGVVTFAVLALLSLILPRRTRRLATANLTSVVMTTAVGEVAGVVITACVLVLVCLLAVAAAALAFMFFAAYVMAYALVIAFLGALALGALRR